MVEWVDGDGLVCQVRTSAWTWSSSLCRRSLLSSSFRPTSAATARTRSHRGSNGSASPLSLVSFPSLYAFVYLYCIDKNINKFSSLRHGVRSQFKRLKQPKSFCDVVHYYIEYTQNCFTALWILSGTTRVSRYQKKHSHTNTYRGHQSSLVTSTSHWISLWISL